MTRPSYCIIDPGTLPEKLISDHGSYADMGVRLLARCLDQFDHTTCKIDAGETLPEAHEFDGYLIMGSEHSVNDDLPWIEPLLVFIEQVYSAQIPLVGLCFGHQAIARGLGGKVETVGWNVGVDEYCSREDANSFRTIVYHQDQVIELTENAIVEYSSDRCPNAVLRYSASPCWTTQSHPEFLIEFARDLFEDTRYDPLTDAQCDNAKLDLESFEADLSVIERGIKRVFSPERKHKQP